MSDRIPFDALVVAAVTHELQSWCGARIQKIWQPDGESIILELYLRGTAWLWIGWDNEFFRLYLSPRKPPSMGESPSFCMAMRSRIEDGVLQTVNQIDRDRLVELRVGDHSLIVELMGKHSNAILVGPDGKVVSAGKVVGPAKSKRPILPGRSYERPPTAPGVSPFLKKWLASGGAGNDVEAVFAGASSSAVYSAGNGAYPVSVSRLGYDEIPRDSICIALANYFDVAIPQRRLMARRSALLTQLKRVLLARETAISDLEQAQDAVVMAGQRQRMGELILAYQGSITLGDSLLRAFDYDGSEIEIPLNPTKTAVENATLLFEKAKKSKSRKDLIRDQLLRYRSERADVRHLISMVEDASISEMDSAEKEAADRRWLNLQKPAPETPEDRPFGGKRIREMLGPGGWTILVGENAEANDFLTLRVAKPDDWWFHVRGAVSSHVAILTRRKPDKVPREVIEFAAKVCAKHSGQKHASYVPVDYTMKRYVRKIRGAPLGTVQYTHEKTIHVDPAL